VTVWGPLLCVGGLLVLVGVVLEARALVSKRSGDTLSEYIRPWARRHPGVFVGAIGVVAGLLAWLPNHILG
jgi:hypothetical protein